MEFQFDPADAEFREEVRDFVVKNLPADIKGRMEHSFHMDGEDQTRWNSILHTRGWEAPSWTEEFGGPGWSLMQQFIFEQVLFEERAPGIDTAAVKMIGPIINRFGNAEQRARFIEPWRRGEIRWGQGFSEPGSGSDLASLKTRAERDGDDYIINGHKIWTSGAHFSNWLFCLVKTDPEQKQRGISLILVPADAPGVTIRPIIDIGEGHSLNEVFFDNVRTSATNLIGEENKGWTYAKSLLENERAFSAEVPRNRRYLATLKRLATDCTRAGRRLIDDPAFAARIAQLESDFQALEWMTLRALTAKAGGDQSLPSGSIMKVRGSELLQKITEMQIECLGDQGGYVHLESDTPDAVPGPDYAPGLLADFMYRRATTIYGGSNEIQRTIIAKSFLGL